MKSVILVNPPGCRRYHRDYYCSESPKANYLFHPVDLLYQSGLLKNYFQITVIDAIALGQSEFQVLQQKEIISADFCFGLISGASLEEDISFYTQLKIKNPKINIVLSGDYLRERGRPAFAELQFLDGILTNFFSQDLLLFWLGEEKIFKDLVLAKTPIETSPKTGALLDLQEMRVPRTETLPAYEFFQLETYRFPFAKRKKYMTVLTDFGCPYTCSYCPMGTLEHSYRSLDEVHAELLAISNLGIRELFIRDQSFGINPHRTSALLNLLQQFNFEWTCFVRPNYFDNSLAQRLRDSGCHTIMFGVETLSNQVLQKLSRNIIHQDLILTIQAARKNNLKTVATVILGLPNDTREGMAETLDFVIKNDLDFVSFNIATARYGTKLLKQSIDNGWLSANTAIGNSGIDGSDWQNLPLSRNEILQFKSFAYKKFYFRFRYVLKKLFFIQSWEQASVLLTQGLAILQRR